jgi:hypothetical protein
MNTKSKQDRNKERPTTRQKQGPKKQGQNPTLQNNRKHEEHEHPETRLTR